MKEKAQKFMKKGIEIVKMNEAAIDAGASAYVKIDVPDSWADAEDAPKLLPSMVRRSLSRWLTAS